MSTEMFIAGCIVIAAITAVGLVIVCNYSFTKWCPQAMGIMEKD